MKTLIRWLNSISQGQCTDKIKEVTGQERRLETIGGIKDKQGEILFEKEDIKKKRAEYIEELFHDDREENP